jgi:hypothetical protein
MGGRIKQVVILDPALRELGGHHPATIQALAESETIKNGKLNLDVFAHRDCSEQEILLTHADHVTLLPFFSTNFYQHFYQQPDIQRLQPYIRLLANEYFSAIMASLNKHADKSLLFWSHTLSWQHAYALAIALDRLQQKKLTNLNYSVVIGLMYQPIPSGAVQSGQQLSLILRQKMKFELAFRYLARQASVTFFAADYELQQAYRSLLNNDDVPHKIAIQPCLLLGSSHPVVQRSNRQQVMLYVGDAKINKGFLQLADIALQLVKRYPEIQFIAQYSISNDAPELADVDHGLLHLARQYENLSVINHFIEHQTLMSLFSHSCAIIFNYDSKTYQHQSSGVLWLAAYYQLTVYCLTETWILREASRLGLTCQKITLEDLTSNTIRWQQSPSVDCEDIHYKNQLFQDIGCWLSAQFYI